MKSCNTHIKNSINSAAENFSGYSRLLSYGHICSSGTDNCHKGVPYCSCPILYYAGFPVINRIRENPGNRLVVPFISPCAHYAAVSCELIKNVSYLFRSFPFTIDNLGKTGSDLPVIIYVSKAHVLVGKFLQQAKALILADCSLFYLFKNFLYVFLVHILSQLCCFILLSFQALF